MQWTHTIVGLQWCYDRARRILARYQVNLAGDLQGPDADRKLQAKEEKDLLLSLLRLRQACCHPQVISRSHQFLILCLSLGPIKEARERNHHCICDLLLGI